MMPDAQLFSDLAVALGPAGALAYMFWKLSTKTIVRVVTEFQISLKQQRDDFVGEAVRRDAMFREILMTELKAEREQTNKIISRIPKAAWG